MTNQNITLLKIEKFVHTYPNIIFFQHNNLSVKQWSQLRIQLKQIKKSNLLVLKNSIIETVILEQNSSRKSQLDNIFQGPCFAIGFLQETQLSEIIRLTQSISNIYLLGGKFNEKLLTHLDILKFLQLDKTVYYNFIDNLNQPQLFSNTLQNSIELSVLKQVPLNFLHCLEVLKLKRQSEIFCVYLN